MTIPSREQGPASARRWWLHAFSAASALALLTALGCAGPPIPVDAPPTVVIPPPVSAAAAIPAATASAVSAPLPAPSSTASAPSPAPAADRSSCRPHPPAVRFEVENDDVVVPLDAQGCPLGESHFKANGFSYQASVDFITELQRRLKAGDKAGLAELVNYPLHFNRGKGTTALVKDRAAFLGSYDHIYTPDFIRTILAADPRDLFCNSRGVMVGNGILWADRTAKGHYGLIAANAP